MADRFFIAILYCVVNESVELMHKDTRSFTSHAVVSALFLLEFCMSILRLLASMVSLYSAGCLSDRALTRHTCGKCLCLQGTEGIDGAFSRRGLRIDSGG